MRSSQAYEPRNALNAICPYFTMFPLEYPLRVLAGHRMAKPVVMDPFCGRGTTLFAARALGLVSRGIDTSPVAVAIAQAKLCEVNKDAVLDLAASFIKGGRTGIIPDSDFFRHAFDASVLRQLCAVRQGLLETTRETSASVLLRAASLGCLHGPRNKFQDSQSYFSNQMPRTFATKPDYSVRYWTSKRIAPPKVNVLTVLRRKLSRIENSKPPQNVSFANVRLGDSRYATSMREKDRDFSVVVTSPPYYGMRTYVEDQWLRNWFLGGPDHVEYGNSDQLRHDGTVAFVESLGAVWRNMSRTRAGRLQMYIRFGAIPSSKVDPVTLIRSSLEASGISWRIISTRAAATASSGKRQADHMSLGSAATLEFDFNVSRD